MSHDESVMMVTSPLFRTLKTLFLSLKLDKMIIELQKRPENEREERPVNDGPARGVRIQMENLGTEEWEDWDPKYI